MRLEPPPPIIEVAVEPRSRADAERFAAALARLAADDPAIGITTDEGSGQAILGGVSEAQLEEAVERLRREGVAVNVGAPQVAYRERLGKRATIDHTYKKQLDGAGEFARVILVFDPAPPGSGFIFENAVAGGEVPEEFIPAVRAGLEAAKESGPLAGFPLPDFKATLIGGAFHDLDSSAQSFELAARAAFRKLRTEGDLHLLEPVVRVEVVTPEAYQSDVVGDLTSRRGRMERIDARGDLLSIAAFVPLSNMVGYPANLRGMSQGLAQFSMTYSHYAPTPVPQPPEDDPPTFRPAMGMRA